MDYIKRIEYATRISLSAPNMVTHEERQEAEEVLLAFRRSKAPYHVCTTILETSTVDSVQFQAAAAMKEAILREWNVISAQVKLSLRQFVLDFVTNKPSVTGFVRESLCSVLAVMLKRSSIDDDDPAQRAPFYQHLTQLVASGDPMKEKTACSVLSALCTEFAASDKSSNVGVTWEQHIKCKRQFEQNDLCQIFELVLQVLRHIQSVSTATLTGSEASLCEKVYVIAEQILSWQFSLSVYPRRIALIQDSTIKLSFSPPRAWMSVLCDPSLLQLFWQLHEKVRRNESLCHASISCLSQLASVRGGIYVDEQQQMHYLGNFIQGFLSIYSSGSVEVFEALGVSNVVRNLSESHHMDVWAMLPREHNLFPTFLQIITHITCNFGKKAAEEEQEVDEEDQLYMEAYDNILDMWTNFVAEMPEEDKPTFLSPCASHIVECFIHCHLAPPDGIRKKPSQDEDIDELDENDIEKFSAQLISIASLARTTPQTTIPLLCRMLEDRTSRLHGQLHRTQQHTSDPHPSSSDVLEDLFEDLHWIILMAGHLLTDDCDGELLLIPPEIMRYSISQKSTVDENLTLRVLGSPKEKVSDIQGAEHSSDYVIRLVSDIIRLTEVQSDVLKHGMVGFLSPQLGQDTMWFFKTWSTTYLLFPEEYFKELSPVISSAFGRNSDGAKWLIGYIISQVVVCLSHWSAEADLLLETCDVLYNLVNHDERCAILVECADFWNFCKEFCSNNPPYSDLPNYIKQKVMTSLVLAGSAKMNVYKEKYWEQTLEPLKNRYKHLVSKDWFAKAANDENVRREVSALLILLQGVSIASRPENSCLLFGYLCDVLRGKSIYHPLPSVAANSSNTHRTLAVSKAIATTRVVPITTATTDAVTTRVATTDDTFVSCDSPGYLDAAVYPLADAQLIFCGGFLNGSSREYGDHVYGLVSLTYARPCSKGLMDCQMYIKHSDRKLILLRNITHTNALSIIQVKEVFTAEPSNTNHTSKRLLREKPTNENHGLYFLPAAVSDRKQVLSFLRKLAKKCSAQTQCDQLYHWSLALLQSYSKHNIGKRTINSEEDAFQDVTLLIELLTNILSKDLIDFNGSDSELQAEVIIRPGENETSAADVVLYGLNIILPLVNAQLLLYPSFCFQYFKLVTFLCEIYPEKIEKLPAPMLQCFVLSLQAGLSSYGSDNCKLCLEAVEGLAGQCLKTKDTPTPLHAPTSSFIRLVFDTLIVHAADMDLLRSAGDAFFTLLCFQPQQALQVFHQIVESQSDDSYKRRLSEAFSQLVPDISKLDPGRLQRAAFLRTLENVIFNIRGILCVK